MVVTIAIDANDLTLARWVLADWERQRPKEVLVWRKRLEIELAAALRKSRAPRNPLGVVAIGLALLIAAGITFALARDPSGVMQAMNEMLRR